MDAAFAALMRWKGMKTVFGTATLAALLLVSPVLAQDFLAPLQEMVEEFTQGSDAAPGTPRVAPKSVGDVAPPPVPRPRPPSLPDVPVVATPAGVTVEAEPEAPAEEAVSEEEEAPVLEEEPEAPVPTPEPEPEVATPVAAAPPADDRVYQTACPAVIQGLVEAETAPPLSEGICGERSPLVVTGVMSRGRMVPLSSPVTTNCEMASALPGWVASVDGYASAMLESPVATVMTGTSYMCRERVSGEKTDFTSEHGFANAVDVTGFTLADGRVVDVTKNWLPAAEPEGRLLRLAHDAACAGFTTVLGPEANAEHHDHLHLDLGCHGQSCTAQICE